MRLAQAGTPHGYPACLGGPGSQQGPHPPRLVRLGHWPQVAPTQLLCEVLRAHICTQEFWRPAVSCFCPICGSQPFGCHSPIKGPLYIPPPPKVNGHRWPTFLLCKKGHFIEQHYSNEMPPFHSRKAEDSISDQGLVVSWFFKNLFLLCPRLLSAQPWLPSTAVGQRSSRS